MAYNQAWDEAAPDGATTKANTIDTVIQELKKSIRERMADLLHADTSWETDADEPKKIKYSAIEDPPVIALPENFSFSVQSSAPSNPTIGDLWYNTTLGVLFLRGTYKRLLIANDESPEEIIIRRLDFSLDSRIKLGTSLSLDGVAFDGSNVLVSVSRQIRFYSLLSLVQDASKLITLSTLANQTLSGISVYSGNLYVAHKRTGGVSANVSVFNLATKLVNSSLSFSISTSTIRPTAIFVSQDLIYVTSSRKLFAFNHSGVYQATNSFDFHSDNRDGRGLSILDGNAYVLDRVDDLIYVYSLSDGSRQEGKEMNIPAYISGSGLAHIELVNQWLFVGG